MTTRRIRARVLTAILLVTAFLLTLSAGCDFLASDTSTTHKVEVKAALDDGIVVAVHDLLPDTPYGSRFGAAPEETQMLCPGAAFYDGTNLRNRALLRFDISDWTEGDITFRGYCTLTLGSPEFPTTRSGQSSLLIFPKAIAVPTVGES